MFKNNYKEYKKSNDYALGKLGEDIACDYLIRKGYTIVSRNEKNLMGEIDIIATIDDVLVFVEVKARETTDFGLPQEAVTPIKQQKIRKTATYYLKRKKLLDKVACRFDCIAIIAKGNSFNIDHIENAF